MRDATNATNNLPNGLRTKVLGRGETVTSPLDLYI